MKTDKDPWDREAGDLWGDTEREEDLRKSPRIL